MSGIADAVTSALAHSLWQDAVIALVTGATLRLLRHRSPNARYAVSCLALAAMAALPVFTAAGIYKDAGRIDADPVLVARTLSDVSGPSAAGAPSTPAVPPDREEPPVETLRRWALPVWMAGVVLFSLRLAQAETHVRRARRRATVADERTAAVLSRLAHRLGVTRPVRLAITGAFGGPATVGWIKPLVLVPSATLLALSPAQLEALLAHELGHIRRHDYLVNLGQLLTETLYFYHPGIWWLSSRIRAERELCCDDVVLKAGGDPLTYAQALARVANGNDQSPALAATGGPLVRRVQRILSAPAAHATVPGSVPLVVAVLVAGALLIARAQDQVAGTITPAPRQETVLRGTVIDLSTGQPVKAARVRAWHVSGIPVPNRPTGPIGVDEPNENTGPHPVYFAESDERGAFEMLGLAPGEYLVAAGGPGYLTRYFGQTGDNRPEATVLVAVGVPAHNVNLRIARTGTIAGRVVDTDGKGISGIEIVAMKRQYQPGGSRPVGVAFAQTEANGEFHLENLPDGGYFISAAAPDGVRPRGGERALIYAPVYYPATPSLEAAQLVGLAAGQVLDGMDMVMTTTRLRSVSGRLVDPQGRSFAGVAVQLMPPPADGLVRLRSDVSADGRFRIADVPPGTHTVIVSDRSAREWLPREVRVDDDITDVQVVATLAVTLRGRVVVEGGGALPFDPGELLVSLQPATDTGTFRFSAGFARINRDGTFIINSRPSAVLLEVSRVPRGWFLKSASLDGTGITDTAFDLLPSTGERHVEIVLTPRGGRLAGTVADRSGRAVENALVVIFPADRNRWTSARLMQTTFSHQQGRFDFGAIPAEDYRIVAVPSLPHRAWADPDVLARLWTDSIGVRVREGERPSVSLELAAAPTDLFQ